MWPEVKACQEAQKRNLKIHGSVLTQRLKEANSSNQTEAGCLPSDALDSICESLVTLELSGSSLLTALPPSVGRLQDVYELILSSNRLRSLPEEIGNMTSLRTLILGDNKLKSLPASLGQLAQLQTLNISSNCLTALSSAALSGLTNLLVLNASFNRLTAIPAVLCTLPKLSTLSFASNMLASIPTQLKALPALTSLDVSSNSLKTLPSTLGDCARLKTLLLDNNPLEDRKLGKIIKEGKVKNVLAHVKKFGDKGQEASKQAGESEDISSTAESKTPSGAALLSLPFSLMKLDSEDNHDVYVDPAIKGVRPHIVCAIIQGLPLTSELYSKLMDLQTELHQALCNKRKLAAIGTHDLAKVQLPLYYNALPPSEICFVPLRRRAEAADQGSAATAVQTPVHADQLSSYFEGDVTMLKYLSYIQSQKKYAVLHDSYKQVLSLPPVINSEYSRLDADVDHGRSTGAAAAAAKDVLVEVTSHTSQDFCQAVLLDFLGKVAEVVGDGHSTLNVAPVRIRSSDGHVRLTFPKC